MRQEFSVLPKIRHVAYGIEDRPIGRTLFVRMALVLDLHRPCAQTLGAEDMITRQLSRGKFQATVTILHSIRADRTLPVLLQQLRHTHHSQKGFGGIGV